MDFSDCFSLDKCEDGFWESFMYSLIEGVSSGLEIDRSDIDGTIYKQRNGNVSIILFDTVPGGAGHVKRLMEPDAFFLALNMAYKIIDRCDCGGEIKDVSCYSCLRNYYNQYCHEKMKRKYAIWGLKMLLGNQPLIEKRL